MAGNLRWTPQKVVWVSLIMFWVSGDGTRERFLKARQIVSRIHPRWTLPVSLGGFLAAQERVWSQIHRELIARLRPETEWLDQLRVRGWMVLAVDGSKFDCPRTAENEALLSGEARKTPQLFHTTVLHVGTGLPWDFQVGPGLESERRQFDRLVQALPDSSIVVADAGFISYALCQSLMRSGRSFVFRVAGNMRLVEGLSSSFADISEATGRDLTCLWPKEESSQQPILLRRVTIKSDIAQPVVLVTNILDVNRLPDDDLKQIYRHRWELELYYRTFKQTWKFGVLRSRTPDTAFLEHRWRFVAHWALRRLTVHITLKSRGQPKQLSQAQLRRLIQSLLDDADAGRDALPFADELQSRMLDTYVRTHAKSRRRWPHKSRHKEPKPPKLRQATAKEVQQAVQLGFHYTKPG
jgi:hypothetical protein